MSIYLSISFKKKSKYTKKKANEDVLISISKLTTLTRK